ncbi:hypothetical protein VTN00DRAFT_4444 [Thermoascus crustaceus]|uniref:uncharacterized protein n=1 Tax=Thermoascus crustaceus TaxID=5088 RepID=UPI0037446AB7
MQQNGGVACSSGCGHGCDGGACQNKRSEVDVGDTTTKLGVLGTGGFLRLELGPSPARSSGGRAARQKENRRTNNQSSGGQALHTPLQMAPAPVGC